MTSTTLTREPALLTPPATSGGRPFPSLPGRPSGESSVGADGDARRPSNPPQHLRALAEANQRRLAFAAIKSEIAALPATAGRMLVANHLRCPNDTIAAMRVGWVHGAIYRVSDATIRRIVTEASASLGTTRPISEDKRIGELTQRQRDAIADVLVGAIR